MKMPKLLLTAVFFSLSFSPQSHGSATRADFENALKFHLDSLVAQQAESGAFPEMQCSDKIMNHDCRSEDSIFMTGLIVDAVSPLKKLTEMEPVFGSALKFLHRRQAQWGLMKYFPLWSFRQLLIKKDTDVNGIILGLLNRNEYPIKQKLIDKFLKRTLISRKIEKHDGSESITENVLATWLNPSRPLFWDVDAVVNANALWFFESVGKPLPGVCNYLNQVATWMTEGDGWLSYYKYNSRYWGDFDKGRDHSYSAWYPSPYAFAYSLSRAWAQRQESCLEPAIEKVERYLLSKSDYDRDWQLNHYDLAVGAATLSRITEHRQARGEDVSRHQTHLKEILERLINQRKETTQSEGIKNGFYYYGYAGYIGSPALDEALVVEALYRYLAGAT
jgi:hypothetical protein